MKLNTPSMRTWFFGLGEKTPAGKQYCEMAKVAVHTALQHTSLRPHFIYDGEENFFTRWLRDREIPIIRHKSSLASAFPNVHDLDQDVPLAAALSSGSTYLRWPRKGCRRQNSLHGL